MKQKPMNSICRFTVGIVLVALRATFVVSASLRGADDAKPESQAGLTVAYKMPADGQLTLGLFGKDGRLLRWVAKDDFRFTGDNREAWDGLDQWGQPVPAGDYLLKAAYHGPLANDYKLTVCNPGNPPWPTPDDKGDWLSDEANPQAIVTDGKWIFLGAAGCELGASVIGLDETGQRQWGVRVAFYPRCVSLALDHDYLYVLYSTPELTDKSSVFARTNAIERAILMCLDKRTGKPAKFTRDNPRLSVASWRYREEVSWLWDLRNNKSFTPATYGGQPRYFRTDVGESTGALGLAAAGNGKLYVSLFYDNKLLVLDVATGKPTGEEIPLDAPVGVCALDENTLLAVSGQRVMKVTLATKTATPLITSGLLAPHSIATDKAGQVFVSDWGASFQVKVFTPDGKFLRSIGKAGGRPWVGAWDRNGLLVPRGIAVTDDGKLWVAEDDGSPKRISLWDAATGAFLSERIGPAPYAGGSYFWIDPSDPTAINVEGTRFKADFAHKTYTPEAITYRRRNRDDPFTPNGHNLGPTAQVRTLYHAGREYAVCNHDRGILSILQRDGDIYRAVAAFGTVHCDPQAKLSGDGTGTFTGDGGGHHLYEGFFPDCFRGHLGDNYSWTDIDGDGLVQPGEMRWVKTLSGPYVPGAQGRITSYWGNDISPDWSYFFAARFRDRLAICRVDPKGWTAAGAPIYDMAEARPIAFEASDHNIFSIHATGDRKLIVCFDYEYGHSPDAMVCYDLDGRRLWSSAMPKRFEGTPLHANNAMYDFQIPPLGDVVCTSLYHGNYRPYLFTSDGLYLGTLLDTTSKLGPAACWGESHSFFHQTDGQFYIINGGNQAEHIFQITGLESNAVGRFEANYRLTDADVQKAAALRTVPQPKAPPKPALAVTWFATPPAIDGDLSDWNLARGVSLDGGKDRSADIALGRDSANLYVAFKVREPKPMCNGGADWQTLFASGDCADLMLSTDPTAAPHHRAAVAGDLRLLFTLFQGQPIAVLYRPVMSAGTSPTTIGPARFDLIQKLASARVAIRRDTEHGCYTVEAAVPFADLALDPRRAGDLRGDVGVIFADESGRSRSLRLYFYNRHTEMISDIPSEATLQPAEWGALVMPLGPNLLQNGGFEERLVTSRADVDKGWFVTGQKNGSTASLSTESPHSGHHALLLATTVPVTFPSAAYDFPNYEDFRKSANNGQGAGWVEIIQKVPVKAAHRYSLRYRYRCEDFHPERKPPGHPRGYVAFGGRIEWNSQPPQPTPANGLGNFHESMPDWRTITDYRDWDMARPYTAPEGAVSATIIFGMTTLAEGRLPRLFLDDVEFVDVTP